MNFTELDAAIDAKRQELATLENARTNKLFKCKYCAMGNYVKTDKPRIPQIGGGENPCQWVCDNPNCKRVATEILSQELDKINTAMMHQFCPCIL